MSLQARHKQPQQNFIHQQASHARDSKQAELNFFPGTVTTVREDEVDTKQVAEDDTDSNAQQVRQQVGEANNLGQPVQQREIGPKHQQTRAKVSDDLSRGIFR